MTYNEKNAAGGMATAGTLKNHCSDLPIGLATFTVGTCRAVSLRVAVEAHRAEANPSPWCGCYAGLRDARGTRSWEPPRRSQWPSQGPLPGDELTSSTSGP